MTVSHLVANPLKFDSITQWLSGSHSSYSPLSPPRSSYTSGINRSDRDLLIHDATYWRAKNEMCRRSFLPVGGLVGRGMALSNSSCVPWDDRNFGCVAVVATLAICLSLGHSMGCDSSVEKYRRMSDFSRRLNDGPQVPEMRDKSSPWPMDHVPRMSRYLSGVRRVPRHAELISG